jgi:DNA-directed RNA polymerase specialized sigma24 family protein
MFAPADKEAGMSGAERNGTPESRADGVFAAALSGEGTERDALLDLIEKRLRWHLRRTHAKPEEHEELIAEAVKAAWWALSSLRDIAALDHLLRTIAQRVYSRFRRVSRQIQRDRVFLSEISRDAEPESQDRDPAERESIMYAISRLRVNRSAIFVAHCVFDESLAQIARERNVSLKALRIEWNETLRQLRSLLQPPSAGR